MNSTEFWLYATACFIWGAACGRLIKRRWLFFVAVVAGTSAFYLLIKVARA